MRRRWMLAALAAVMLCLSGCGMEDCHGWSRQLGTAIRDGDTQKALALIREGKQRGYSMDSLSYERTFLLTLVEQPIYTPLEEAIRARNVTVVQALLENGACPNEFGSASVGGSGNGESPVWWVVIASQYSPEDLEILQLLISHGADVSAKTAHGYPILLVIEKSWSHARLPEDECTPEAISEGITALVRCMAQHTDVHVRSAHGQTALHVAARHRNWLLCRVLAEEYGLDCSLKDGNGQTAYDYALQNDAPEELLSVLRPADWVHPRERR
ncbi:MAG: hypothetical protein IJ343_00775 [Clostridia bacterium]|nr:hypothetical protein [Clostridia bacterium]